MSSIPAKVVAMEKRNDQFFQMVIQIGTKYRGSFNTLLFGEIKPYTGFLKNGRLDSVHRVISRRHTVGFKRVWMRGVSEEHI